MIRPPLVRGFSSPRTFGYAFAQPLEGSQLPAGLQCLIFGTWTWTLMMIANVYNPIIKFGNHEKLIKITFNWKHPKVIQSSGK
jgi:hypothetical protein